jgi:hypothetical protein
MKSENLFSTLTIISHTLSQPLQSLAATNLIDRDLNSKPQPDRGFIRRRTLLMADDMEKKNQQTGQSGQQGQGQNQQGGQVGQNQPKKDNQQEQDELNRDRQRKSA